MRSLPGRILAGAGLVFLLSPGAGEAQLVELMSKADSGSLSDTPGADSLPLSVSADGRFVLFQSLGDNLVPGQVDGNGGEDLFLHDRSAGTTVLVSHVPGAASKTADRRSHFGEISADGAFVVFQSEATNLVSGQVDSNGSDDIFLYDCASGTVTLVSHAAGSPTTTGDGFSGTFLFPPASSFISGDGGFVVFDSFATNLVTGQTDVNFGSDVFLYDRVSGVLSLVSHIPGSTTTTGDNASRDPRVSGDGAFIAFTSAANDLVAGQIDVNGSDDVFVYDRMAGVTSLVSRADGATTTTGDQLSFGAQMSFDGGWIAFMSSSTNLVPGQTDTNFIEDVFLYERVTGAMTLVSHVPASASTTGDSGSGLFPEGISITDDGAYVAFLSWAGNLVTGQVDGGAQDAFLFERASGLVSLVSAQAGSPTTTANGPSVALWISGGGEQVTLVSQGSDLVAGQTDTNFANDVFVYDRISGTMSLASHVSGSAITTGNGVSDGALISRDASVVLYRSDVGNLVSGVSDLNGRSDVFAYEVGSGTNTLVSGRDPGLPSASANAGSAARDLSDDGRYALFDTTATNVVPGQIDQNAGVDVFLYDRLTGNVTLVSREDGTTSTTGNSIASGELLSADGTHVVFGSGATNLVPGQVDGNGGSDIFLYEIATDTMTLVSHVPGLPQTAADRASFSPTVSADGSYVAFRGTASNLIPGQVDPNGTAPDVFLFEKATGVVTLVSHVPASATTTGNDRCDGFPQVSRDGNWVAFMCRATNLVTGQFDTNGQNDVFLFERATGTVRLLSGASSSTTNTGNERSDTPLVAGDGSFVGFRSRATNLVSGQVDANGTYDIFLYDVGSSSTRLVSRSIAAATTAANAGSFDFDLSADAAFITFATAATDIIAGQVDNATTDVFVYERLTTSSVLASARLGSTTETGNGVSDNPRISGDGNFVTFRSFATDLASGQLDANSTTDVFLFDRLGGTTSVVSLKAATTATTGNAFSDIPHVNFDGSFVAFRSRANDLVAQDFNANGDAFLYGRLTQATDLTLTKDDGQSTAVPGEPITYTLTVTNNGPLSLTSVVLTDSVPPEILGPVFTPSVGTYNSGTGDWTGLTLDPATSVTMTLTGTIDPAARGTLVNTASVSPPSPIVDSLPPDNTATDSNTLTPEADLELIKTDSPDPVDTGSILTYTLTITNHGPSEATGVTVFDPLPPVTFVSSTPGAPTCTFDGEDLNCNLGTLAPTNTTIVTIDVVANFAGLSNGAIANANETDPDTSNNADSEGTIVQVPTDAVRFFTTTAKDGTNKLEWVNPTPVDYVATHLVYNPAGFPANEIDGTVLKMGGSPGARDFFDHTGLANDTVHYYGIFVERVSGFSAGRFSAGRPFDVSGPVKWAYTTGATSMAPPAIGSVYPVSNDRVLHSVVSGAGGGDWPPGWVPYEVPQPVQSRPPVVSVPIGAANKVVFLGAQDGHVYAVDAETGGFLWMSPSLGDRVQAAPAGMFTQFGGAHDLLLVGSRNSSADNIFYGLQLSNGGIAWQFDNLAGSGGIGIVSGMASVDYKNTRVYFTSRTQAAGSASTVWGLDFTDTSAVLKWERALGNSDASPVLEGSTVYVGTVNGEVHALDADTGASLWASPFSTGDGAVKGFIWPDPRSTNLYFSTTTKIWSISDDGGSASLNWSESSVPSPSVPLLMFWSGHLLAGGGDGKLYQLDVSLPSPAITSVTLGDGTAAVGSPSMNVRLGIAYAGNDEGIVHAIAVPLPP